MLGNYSPKFTISLLLLIVSIVFVFAEEMIEESSGSIDFNHPKWSSTKFLLRDRGSLDSSQILHRKLGYVMVTPKNIEKGNEFINCDKRKCKGSFSQKLHNVPSGPNPIGNFASMGVQPP